MGREGGREREGGVVNREKGEGGKKDGGNGTVARGREKEREEDSQGREKNGGGGGRKTL